MKLKLKIMIMQNRIRIYLMATLVLIMTHLYSCKKDSEASLAVLTTRMNKITQSTATFSGYLLNNGGATITGRGFCLSTNHNPTISDDCIAGYSNTTLFTNTVSGFPPNITYYVRSFARNSKGIAYGNEQSFTLWINTPGPNVTDIDGNSYSSVKIGTQVWMVQNLRTTKYRNGDLIGTTTPDTLDIRNENTPKYQWIYKGYEDKVAIYGRLYTWYAVSDSRNIAPLGWHVPLYDEWAILFDYLNEQYIPGAKLKETGTTHWIKPNTGADNSSGFTGLPGGEREVDGAFNYIGYYGKWWSAGDYNVDAWNQYLFYDSNDFSGTYVMNKLGISVRCVKDY
jgi:uncharacterized protein (TIGR02145 family)